MNGTAQPPARRALLRADASAGIGTGHVTRCTTLAAELVRRGWRAELATRDLPDGLRAGIQDHGITILAIDPTVELAVEPAWLHSRIDGTVGVDLLVTDHYGIAAPWHREARRWARSILAIDDLAADPLDADVVLDQNLGVDEAAHRRLIGDGAQLLTGPRYALVRPEFAATRRAAIDRASSRAGRIDRILVFLSGADPERLSVRVAEVAAASGAAVDVVVGAAYPDPDGLRAWAARKAQVTVHVQTPRMAELMASADLAIGAPGSASWERCTLGLPTVLLTLAPNQALGARALAAAGAAISLGPYGDRSVAELEDTVRNLQAHPDRVRSMAQAAAAITDGRGTERVADVVERVVAGDPA